MAAGKDKGVVNLPWMPLYVADYLADTRRLSTLEHGAYLLLIMEYWQHGGLPNDDRALAKVCGLTPREWTRCRAALAPMFGEGWKHKRIDEELEKAAKNKETNTTRAAAAAKARYDKQARRKQEASNEDAPGLPEERSGHAPSMLEDHSKDTTSPSPSPEEERVPYETLSSSSSPERESAATARDDLLNGKPSPRASDAKAPLPDTPQRVFVAFDTPEWSAWARYDRARGQIPKSPNSHHEGRNGWWFDSPMPPKGEAAA